MSEKEITLHFDLDDERENRIYFALKKIPNFLNEPNLSKAIILFVDNAINAITECDERTARCEETLKSILGPQAQGRTEWQWLFYTALAERTMLVNPAIYIKPYKFSWLSVFLKKLLPPFQTKNMLFLVKQKLK